MRSTTYRARAVFVAALSLNAMLPQESVAAPGEAHIVRTMATRVSPTEVRFTGHIETALAAESFQVVTYVRTDAFYRSWYVEGSSQVDADGRFEFTAHISSDVASAVLVLAEQSVDLDDANHCLGGVCPGLGDVPIAREQLSDVDAHHDVPAAVCDAVPNLELRVRDAAIRAGETTVVEVVGAGEVPDFALDWSAEHTSSDDAGGFSGHGTRVNFTPAESLTGEVTVEATARSGLMACAMLRARLEIQPARPRIILESVTRASDTEVWYEGRVHPLPQAPEEFLVRVFTHSDLFYRTYYYDNGPGVDAQGRFKFRAHVPISSDRAVLMLSHESAELCPTGLCRGVSDQYLRTKSIIPAPIDGVSILDFVTVPVLAPSDGSLLDAQLEHLSRRFVSVPTGRDEPWIRLVRSFLNSDRHYLYDQALAAMVFTHGGEPSVHHAREVLSALERIQLLEPSVDAGGFAPWIVSDGLRTGPIAWVVMAANAYQARTNDDSFRAMAKRALSYLATRQVPVLVDGEPTGPVTYSVDRPETPWNETQTISFEHNLGAYAAFREFALYNADDPDFVRYGQIADEIRVFLERSWNGRAFYIGYDLAREDFNRSEGALDTQSWGLLALDDTDAWTRYGSGLGYNCETYLETAGFVQFGGGGVVGFVHESSTPDARSFVWTEGTLGMIAAMERGARLGQAVPECRRFGRRVEVAELKASMYSLVGKGGGLRYATYTTHPDMSYGSSVAGTAWLYFAAHGINPFRVTGFEQQSE